MTAEGSEFDASWLALRAPADDRARHSALIEAAERVLQARAAPLAVDLGSGAGASFRIFSSRRARWRFVDQDAALLARAARLAGSAGAAAEVLQMDLAAPDAPLAAALQGADLVIASAFLDLTSEAWLDRLAAALPSGAGVYATLSYAGEMDFTPSHPADAAVTQAFNAHQTRDKGFGPALGPQAAQALAEKLERAGRSVRLEPSDWVLQAGRDDALTAELTRGIAGAAEEMGTPAADWLAARGETRAMRVSHLDLFAPPLSTERGYFSAMRGGDESA